jgi:hypothetical protein
MAGAVSFGSAVRAAGWEFVANGVLFAMALAVIGTSPADAAALDGAAWRKSGWLRGAANADAPDRGTSGVASGPVGGAPSGSVPRLMSPASPASAELAPLSSACATLLGSAGSAAGAGLRFEAPVT